MRRALGALIMVWVASSSTAGPAIEPGVSRDLALQRAAVLSGLHYELHLAIPEQREDPIQGHVSITFDYSPDGNDLQLDFREDANRLHSAEVNGHAVDIRFRHEHLLLAKESLREGRNRVDIHFTAGDLSLNRRDDYLYTLFVPDRARTAFPLFDQPDLKGTISLILDLPQHWVGLSNAPLLTKEETEGLTRWRFAETEPISSYLFSFVAGRFEQITRQVGSRSMTLLHRETDTAKVARNVDAIFDLHGSALQWMEAYTGIPLPYRKLDFALIPDFQYNGMEHTGAIQYRASRLLLETEPTQAQRLDRASLISHEVAHMWFGNLVTMKWFDDVWTKEVFANFMAAKMVNPTFPEIDHALNFLVRHYPGAYSVDRTAGANPIRQPLENLNLAGQMYGPIIYLKAPIMMRQLELLLGQDPFRAGLRQYLQGHAHGNATWPDLVAILDKLTASDLAAWSEVWVNTPGRPHFQLARTSAGLALQQADPGGEGRVWPQRFTVRDSAGTTTVDSVKATVAIPNRGDATLLNADGRGYGLFPADPALLDRWSELTDLERGSLLLNLYENVLEGELAPLPYLEALLVVIADGPEPLLLDLALNQLHRIHTSLLPESERERLRPRIESVLWQALQRDVVNRRQLYETYAELAATAPGLAQLEALWSGSSKLEGLTLSERDRTRLAELLAIRQPEKAEAIITRQLQQINNPDNRERLRFIAPSVAAERSTRDRFFASLAKEENRQTERWVLDALGNLHHPSRRAQSLDYLPQALALLEEIQVTGDIFFPARWLEANFGNHNSRAAVQVAREFLAQRPDYNHQLALKIEQAVDFPARAAGMVQAID